MVLESVVVPVVAAVAYSLYTYSGKYIKSNEKFVPKKFARTVFVGLLVGGAVVVGGHELSLNNFEAIAASVGAIHIADVMVGTLWEKAIDKGIIPESWSGEVELP